MLSLTLDFKSFTFEGRQIDGAMGIRFFDDILGSSSRVFEGTTKAPVGHRNNHVHIFDDVGIVLLDDHTSLLIQQMSIIFRLDDPAPFYPKRGFEGAFRLFEEKIDKDTTETQVSRAFEGVLTAFLDVRRGYVGGQYVSIHFSNDRNSGSSKATRKVSMVNIGLGFRKGDIPNTLVADIR
jgi:hypothetical protein